MSGIVEDIGEGPHNFPSVFSFFLPEYKPDGRVGDALLVAPETMVMDMPKTIGLLNGMFSMVKYGFNYCNGGFGDYAGWVPCDEGRPDLYDHANNLAYLSFSRQFDAGSTTAEAQAEAVVSELATILTSGRLSVENKAVIKEAYIEKLPDAAGALRLAQQLILTSPEFHTTNTLKLSGDTRGQVEPPAPSGVPYKAIVYVMFAGGCDSFQMLVPHTCAAKDVYANYVEIRDTVALGKEMLLPIDATSSNQICETFGLHPRLDAVQQMYNDGDMLFFANTGVLTKETDKANYGRDTVTQLFAHNMMQRAAQRVDPLKEKDGTGILGRIADALSKKGLSVGLYSIEQNSVSLIGEPGISQSPFILSRSGLTRFNPSPSSETMRDRINSINEATEADSGVFGDLWSSSLLTSLYNNELLYDTLDQIETVTTFPNSYLGSQLGMVAKMIKTREARGVDADAFFLATGGWDTHTEVNARVDNLYNDVDNSFAAFADEMKLDGMWDNVTVIETSDFARTLNPNGNFGSDHAWGGNYMMFGGSVKGGQIAGTFPDTLTEDGPLSLGRGRMIPTTSWDAVFKVLAEWAGATEEDFDNVVPNRDNFPESHFFNAADLFEMN